jgi:outer membrane biosynthesis protein TonB
MSLTLDPRHLGQLKRFAADAGVRPGELALQWMIERLDAESGRAPQTQAPRPAAPQSGSPDLLARLDALSARISALEARGTSSQKREAPPPNAEAAPPPKAEAAPAPVEAAPTAEAAPTPDKAPTPVAEPESEPTTAAAEAPPAAREPRRRSTPAPRTPSPRATAATQGERVGLHDEIAAVIGERGPMTAADLAVAIAERGRYMAPRSTKPLDAATVNSRVSNPAYRGRFTRSDGRIGLTDAG